MKSKLLLFALPAMLLLSACGTKTETAAATPTPVTTPVPPSQPEAQPAATVETLTGTYIETEQGDYMHALIKGDDGTDYSFFFAPDLDQARADELMEGLWDGKKVKITWRKTEREIPEAGGMMELDEMVSIEAL